MKRDMDLARHILLKMEERSYDESHKPVVVDGWSEEDIFYHVKLLYQAGLIQAIDASSTDGLCWIPTSLTWSGHEFLDAARDDTRWNRTKILIKEKAGVVGFEILKQVLVATMKQSMGLHP
jgi:hypothetical protein